MDKAQVRVLISVKALNFIFVMLPPRTQTNTYKPMWRQKTWLRVEADHK
jgi:hypothetical protein